MADETTYLVAAALDGDDALAAQLGGGAAPPQRPQLQEAPQSPPPLRAFIRSITVEGFRGIGPRAVLEVNPHCGITVISGRNGSGKSSFAEALEYALTGDSYRWRDKKSQQWQSAWRNLHADDPASITVDFAMEADDHRTGTTAEVGASWAPNAKLERSQRWSQIKGQKREAVEALGWDNYLDTHRPLMSYDELGGLFEEGQSALYDALNLILGLDEISDADARLKRAEKQLAEPRKAANTARSQLRKSLEGVDDPRAAQVLQYTARIPYDLDAVTATTLGTATDQAAAITRLRTIAATRVPTEAEAKAVADQLRDAVDEHATQASTVDDTLVARADLLREALNLHTHAGDSQCPVCETGTLDDTWRTAAVGRLDKADAAAGQHRQLTALLKQARTACEGFFAEVETISPAEGIELASLTAFDTALTKALAVPATLADLPAHVETAAQALAEAADSVRREATERADEFDDAWAPHARAISAWVELEVAARQDDERLKQAKAAVTWLRNCADTLRERRLAPMVAQASSIWGRMRHESNVDIGNITLEGSATRRRVVVDGNVDGVPTGALSVMSQGELHALALALFIPRATTTASPFRFLVLDDPIQAMDPAKIGGFLDVLVDLAKTRQVIVFSHDDRLPAAIRARSVPAQLLDVTREQGSNVVVHENNSPADRYATDAEAIIRDERLDDVIKRKAAPGLFRMAVEAAAHQRYFSDQARAGAVYHDTEATWEDAKTTQHRVALALTGNAAGDVAGWKHRRDHRFPTIAIAASGVHRGAALDRTHIQDLRKTIRDIVEDR
ncbi:AAA family ATPase [Tsukamurella pseudospumae]|uniref:AAA family ATPase n=1 Tax=Tsukamurella pseudospumae TaxID=239498 RepID=UPI001FD335EA|nr:AAA family ATPase [Tsukamurella pseudospumae]